MSEFLHMGGYGPYIWSAYGITVMVLVGLVVTTLRSLRANERALKALEKQSTDGETPNP